ncbi:winged helix-turn-helix domain-containing protein [Williamwhitmania taraxaci]|nr:LysR family transcriptional regulator [Williamwhitmania taraxaci]
MRIEIMAGPPGSKYYNIFLDYKISLTGKDNFEVFDEERFILLQNIQDRGSLAGAAEAMAISYRKAWGLIREAEESVGFVLVEKQRGGKDGGRSELTAEGQKLLEAYLELRVEFDAAIHKITKKFFHRLNDQPLLR